MATLQWLDRNWGQVIDSYDMDTIDGEPAGVYLSHLHTHWNDAEDRMDYCTARHGQTFTGPRGTRITVED